MARYIDADDVANAIYHHFPSIRTMADARGIIEEAPTIDIVFCEDCRECIEKGLGVDCPSGYGYLYCRRKKSVVDEDNYCSWGERR